MVLLAWNNELHSKIQDKIIDECPWMPLTCIQNGSKGECQERIQRQADKIIERIQGGHLDFSVLGSRGNQECVTKSGELAW